MKSAMMDWDSRLEKDINNTSPSKETAQERNVMIMHPLRVQHKIVTGHLFFWPESLLQRFWMCMEDAQYVIRYWRGIQSDVPIWYHKWYFPNDACVIMQFLHDVCLTKAIAKKEKIPSTRINVLMLQTEVQSFKRDSALQNQ